LAAKYNRPGFELFGQGVTPRPVETFPTRVEQVKMDLSSEVTLSVSTSIWGTGMIAL
jgi:hypothetical protein